MIKTESGHVKPKFQMILIKWHDHFPSNSQMTFKLWKLYLQINSSFKCSLVKDFTWAGEHLQFWIFSLQQGHTLSLTLGLLSSSSDTNHVPMCRFSTSHSARVLVQDLPSKSPHPPWRGNLLWPSVTQRPNEKQPRSETSINSVQLSFLQLSSLVMLPATNANGV